MDSMNPKPWYKNTPVLVVLVLVVLLGGYWLMKGDNSTPSENNNQNGEEQKVSATPRAGEIAVEGKFSCLPLKSGKTPSAENCVLGIQGNDGKFYAISTLDIEATDPSINAQSSVRAVGTFTPASTSAEAGDLKYDGVLSVRVMEAK